MRRDAEGFADILTHAIRQRDLPLDRIAQRLASVGSPVSVAALSYWKTGRSIPTRAQSLQALFHLERILDVQPGHLTRALPGRGSAAANAPTVPPDAAFITQTLEPLGLDLLPRFSHLTHHESLLAAEDNTQRVVHQLVRCEVEGVQRVPVVMRHTTAGPTAPLLEAIIGCRVGRVVNLPAQGILVAELLLEQIPSPGDHLAWSYRLTDGPRDDVQHLGCTLISPTKYLTVDVTLARPADRFTYTWRQSHEHAPAVTEELPAARFAQRVVCDAPAGHHRLEWR